MATDFPTSSDRSESSFVPEWVDHLISNRQEQTLGGCAIGIVRDVISSDGSSRARAQSNDQIAQIAADTVSFLPEMKWTTGGAIRAALLLDPHGSATDNARGAGLNFLEGAALNKVGKLGASESVLGKFVTGKFGDGLLAETVTHATVGLGMGTVRTGFSAESWKDKSGQFSLAAGGQNVLKNGLIGAAINVPAGMVGVRFSRAATLSLAGKSTELASIVSNAGSGYASGVVFGGLDAVMAHRSWKEVLSGMNEGGIVGGITGGAMHFAGGSRELAIREVPVREESRTIPSQQRLTDGLPADRGLGRHRDALLELRKTELPEDFANPFSDVHIAQPEFQSLRQLGERLHQPEIQRLNFVTVKEGAKLDGPFKSIEDFRKRLDDSPTDMRVYEIAGHSTRILVPEEYARKLDEVRQIRLTAGQDENLTERGSEAYKQIRDARAQLKTHPLGQRALPEDFIPILDALPNRSYIKQLTLSENPDPWDAWNRQTYQAQVKKLAEEVGEDKVPQSLYESARTFYAAAVAQPTERNVIFFKPDRTMFMGDYLFHEWSHITDALLPEDSALFQAAAKLEKNGYFSRDYAMRDVGENLAVHMGEKLINYDGDGFTDVAVQAPLRTAVMGKMLKTVLDNTEPWARSTNHEALVRRLDAVQQFVMPSARDELFNRLATGGRESRKLSMQLIDGLGISPDQSHLELLKGIAVTTKDPETARAAYQHSLDLTQNDRDARFRLYFELGQPGSTVRDQALDGLWRMKDHRAPGYLHYLRALGEAPNAKQMAKIAGSMPDADGRQIAYRDAVRMARGSKDLTTALDIMRSAPDFNIKHFAFGEALSMVGKDQDKALGVALHALTFEPKLRSQALDFLTPMADPRTQRTIQGYLDDPDPQIASRAARANQKIEDGLDRAVENSKFLKLQNELTAGTQDSRIQAVDELSQLMDIRSLRLLVEAAVTGSPTVSDRATEALKKFGSNTVKFEARQWLRKDPAYASRVHKLLSTTPAFAAYAG